MKKSNFAEIAENLAPYPAGERVTPVNPFETFKTRVLIATVIATNVAGNVLLSRGMHQTGSVVGFALWPYLHAILNPFVAAGVLVLVVWMITDLALLSVADLSFVLPVTAIAYVLIAVMGRFVLGERVSPMRWAGIGLITLGVMLVGKTPSRTTPERHHLEEEGEEE